MMNNLAPLNEEEESCINSILEQGIDEIKTNQPSFLASSQMMKKSQSSLVNHSQEQFVKTNQSAALKDAISSMKTSHNYVSSSEEEDYHPISNIAKAATNSIKQGLRPAKSRKLKEMKNKLDALQERIAQMDTKLRSEQSTGQQHQRTLSHRCDSVKTIKKKAKWESCIKKRVKSANKSFRLKSELANGEMMYKEKYLKLKIEFDNAKGVLILQRRRLNDLARKSSKTDKKALAYDELYEDNQRILESNEKLYLKFGESEGIRGEQAKLICSLQKEVERLRGKFDSNNISSSSTAMKDKKSQLNKNNKKK